MKKKHDRHLSSNKRDLEIAKKSQKGGPGTFWFDKEGTKGFFMWNIISKKKDLLHDKPNEKVRKKSVFFIFSQRKFRLFQVRWFVRTLSC